MPQLDYEKAESIRLVSDPYDHLHIPGFITPQALVGINADYPAIDSPANYPLEKLQYGTRFGDLMTELQGEAFARFIGKKFGVDLSRSATTVTVRKYCERTDGNIHTDHRSKIITVLLYFNTDWTAEGGQLRILRSLKDIEDYALEIPPLGGSLVAFRRTNHSYHGHKKFVGERRMVQVNFLSATPMSLFSQRLNRFSTHFMKNVLGVR